MRRINTKTYDFNSLLVITNIFICLVAVYLYVLKGKNQYVNMYTLVLLCVFGVQNIFTLLYEKKRRDPFVLILMADTIFFYIGRISTLLYNPLSTILVRHPFAPDDLNYSLMFIMLSNVSIFLGLSAVKGKIICKEDMSVDIRPANPRAIVMILLLALYITFYHFFLVEFLQRFAGFLRVIFANALVLLLFTLVYLVVNYVRIPRIYRITIITLCMMFIVFSTLSGGRSGMLIVGYTLLIAVLSVKGRIVLNRKWVCMLAIAVLLSIYLFFLGTYIRRTKTYMLAGVSADKLSVLKGQKVADLRTALTPVFDRMGSLDYAARIITDRERYSKVINFVYYFKSITDNVLTPGFYVFNTPRVANALKYIYTGSSKTPTLQDIDKAYQSDMLTIYAEYYVLFGGYPALIALFMVSYVFKKLYLSIKSKDIFLFYLYRALILLVFYYWLDSFGLDWIAFNLTGVFMTFCIFKNFYKMKRRRLNPISIVK